MNSSLYIGQVYHKRMRPSVHALRYRVYSLMLDLDEIDDLHRNIRFFSRNKWNLFSFYDKDFGVHEAAATTTAAVNTGSFEAGVENIVTETLNAYVQRKLGEAGITQKPVKILLSCYPRVCGYTFNPLSLFYCLDSRGDVFAVLHEVHNTFGERHVYVLPVNQLAPSEFADSSEQSDEHHADRSGVNVTNKEQTTAIEWIQQKAEKELFVSPFAHMDMDYTFRLNKPGAKQVIVIKVNDESGHLLTASYTANRSVLDTRQLLRCFFYYPALTAKVTVGIHWEALRLWLKKVPWHTHQPKHTAHGNNAKNT